MKLKRSFYICMLTASILLGMIFVSPSAKAQLVNSQDLDYYYAPYLFTINKLGIPYSKDIASYIQFVYNNCNGYLINDKIEGFPELVIAIMKVESNFNPNIKSSAGCIGLMQVSPYWHADRCRKLNWNPSTDLWNPHCNIQVAMDFINDLYFNYANESIELTVMMYNMDFISARKLYNNGVLSDYALTVFSIQEQLRR